MSCQPSWGRNPRVHRRHRYLGTSTKQGKSANKRAKASHVHPKALEARNPPKQRQLHQASRTHGPMSTGTHEGATKTARARPIRHSHGQKQRVQGGTPLQRVQYKLDTVYLPLCAVVPHRACTCTEALPNKC